MDNDSIYLFLKTHTNNNSYYDDTTFQFTNPITITRHKDHNHMLSIMKLSCNLDMINVIAGTQLQYYHLGVPFLINIPQGNYDTSSIESIINLLMATNGHPALQLIPNFANETFFLTLPANTRIDFTFAGNLLLSNILGFNTNLNNATGSPITYVATNKPQFNYYFDGLGNRIEINKIYIHCSLLSHLSYCNFDTAQNEVRLNSASICFNFILNSQPNTWMLIEPTLLQQLSFKAHNNITELRLFFVNQDNKRLNGVFRSPVYIDINIAKDNTN